MDKKIYCNVCGEIISKGDSCCLAHIRHGNILESVTGTYNGMLGIKEESANSYKDRATSVSNCADSYILLCKKRVYKGQEINFATYIRTRLQQELQENRGDIYKTNLYEVLKLVKQNKAVYTTDWCRERSVYLDAISDLLELYRRMNYRCRTGGKKIALSVPKKMENLLTDIVEISTPLLIGVGSDYSREFNALERVRRDAYSGVACCHLQCCGKKGEYSPSIPSYIC